MGDAWNPDFQLTASFARLTKTFLRAARSNSPCCPQQGLGPVKASLDRQTAAGREDAPACGFRSDARRWPRVHARFVCA